MAKRYQIRFNVRGSTKGPGDLESSFSGHINVTLAETDDDVGKTYGATVLDDAPWSSGLWRGAGKINDGIIKDETLDRKGNKYTWVTRTVPVTEEQYFAIKRRLEGAVDKTYDYAIRPGIGKKAQVCSSFAAAVYKMTGHDGEVGDLFSFEDQRKVPGFVWWWIPGSGAPESYRRNHRPTEPVIGHYPNTEKLGVELHGEAPRYGDGKNGEERGFFEDMREVPWRKVIKPLLAPHFRLSADTPGGEPAKPSVSRNPFQEPETVVPRNQMAASGPAEAETDDEEFDGSTLLTRRRRKKKVTQASAQLATSSAPFDARQMFPNSDHS